jgi:acrylyl-CoA reductase (NADPH)
MTDTKKPTKKTKPAGEKPAKKPAKSSGQTAPGKAAPGLTRTPDLPPLTRYAAIVVANGTSGVAPRLTEVDDDALRANAPPGADVTLRVLYSTVNFKDGLAMYGRAAVVKRYPHVPGVDLVGVVEESGNKSWKPGDVAIVSGFRMGELYWGGFAQRARARGDWLVALPKELSPLRAMAIGTAGLTAMLAVMALEDHGLTPESGDIAVTGSAGGVGSIAIALLAARGFKVAAFTGRPDTHDYLKKLGATTIIEREKLAAPSEKALLPVRFAGAIDAVGGPMLSNLLASLKYGGSVAATGLVGGRELNTTIIPFLLRGVNLLGIEATNCPLPRREKAWARLAADLPMDLLDAMTTVVPLSEVPEIGRKILDGLVQGRVVVDVNR